MAPRLDQLVDAHLFVPIRSSSGESPDPSRIGPEAYRHGTDEHGERFIAAFTSVATLRDHGPPGSDHVRLAARSLFERAESAGERIVVDPGAPTEISVPVGVLGFLVAGLDPNSPDALRARRPLGELPPLEAPGQVPQPFGQELLAVLESMPRVERAWLLRAGTTWAAGIQMTPEAVLGDFDQVRNRLHALATQHLGSRQLLTVTDLRAPALRDAFDAVATPIHVRRGTRSILGRIFGG